MTFCALTQNLFNQLADSAMTELDAGEELNLNLTAEAQTYVRFNHSRVRQATGIVQRNLELTFQKAGRHTGYSFDLTGQLEGDLRTLRWLIERARIEVQCLPEDPLLVPMQNHGTSDHHFPGELPEDGELIAAMAESTTRTDFAGLLAMGPQVRASRNSLGQSHWFSTASLFVNYSLFTVNPAGENKAVKGLYADSRWQRDQFERQVAESRQQLERLQQATRTIAPGNYRVYLAPAAVADIIGMFSWGAVSYRAWREGHSALKSLADGDVSFSEQFNLKENFTLGLTPPFNSLGEMPPHEIPVIECGQLKNLMVSSRSAKEFGVPANGADPGGWGGESLRSPEVRAGHLAPTDILQALDTGLYVSNLHYLNWSDLQSARITGMTRYACFWVERGQMVAPIRDLRFDESLYRMLGSELEALTSESQIHLSTDTYHCRSLGGCKIPGLLIRDFRFTL
jgi:predicted Zn-dependent protease